MDKDDVLKLFDFLGDIHTNRKPDRSPRSVLEWQTILEPWEYRQVRDAAIKRARTNRYFPDPSELAVLLPPPPEDTAPTPERAATGSGYAWQKYIEDNHLEQDDAFSVSRYARECGLSWNEAKEQAKRLGLID